MAAPPRRRQRRGFGVLLSWILGAVPGLCEEELQEVPEELRFALYCPPPDVPLADLHCAGEKYDRMFRTVQREVQLLEEAAFRAVESGRMTAFAGSVVVNFAEFGYAFHCLLQYRCALPEPDYYREVAVRCEGLQFHAMVMRGESVDSTLCFDPGTWQRVVSEALQAVEAINMPGAGGGVRLEHSAAVAPRCAARARPGEGTVRPDGAKDLAAQLGGPEPRGPQRLDERLSSGLYSASVLRSMITLLDPGQPDNFVLNLGAHDGTCEHGVREVVDSANCAFDAGFRGIAVEGNPQTSPGASRWPTGSVELHIGYVSPRNISGIAKASMDRMAATGVSLLKVDVDHADCSFVASLLSSGEIPRPKFMSVEYQRAFPPPIRYREHFRDDVLDDYAIVEDASIVFGLRRHWIGCSMQAWQELAAWHGYLLLWADPFDLVFGRRDIVEQLGLEQLQGDLFDIWLEVAHCRPPGRQRDGLQIDANLDLRRLAEAGPRERCDLALRWWTAEEEYLRSDMSCW